MGPQPVALREVESRQVSRVCALTLELDRADHLRVVVERVQGGAWKSRRPARPWLPSDKIFRPQNCGAAAHTLPATVSDRKIAARCPDIPRD